jgi:hypothetical protein
MARNAAFVEAQKARSGMQVCSIAPEKKRALLSTRFKQHDSHVVRGLDLWRSVQVRTNQHAAHAQHNT